jgi:hypothetical protein
MISNLGERMSYIDTLNSECLGYFGDRAIYRSLEYIPGERTNFDFGCSVDDIIVGGGSGELPAIIFSNSDYCVSHFLLGWLHEQFRGKGEVVVEENLMSFGLNTDELRDEIIVLAETKMAESIAFAGWNALDYYEAVRDYSSGRLKKPYEPEVCSFEIWLAQNVGEFVFFKHSQLLKTSKNLHTALHEVVTPFFDNIRIM